MTESRAKPGLWLLLRLFGAIGVQSFGGGVSTLFLIQREFVDKRSWLSEEEFGQLWSLCNLAPGINLIAITILIGKKARGVPGIIVCTAGMLLPSAAITCLLAAAFTSVKDLPAVQSMLKGIIPATSGIMLVTAIRLARPLLKQANTESKLSLALSLCLIMLAAILIFFKVEVLLVLLGAALLGSAIFNMLAKISPAHEASNESN